MLNILFGFAVAILTVIGYDHVFEEIKDIVEIEGLAKYVVGFKVFL